MRNIFPLLSGNEKLKALLGAHIAEGKLSHAYIFEGDDGSGKMTCALSAAASLACEKRNDALSPLPCGKCTSCRKIFGLFSPDVHIVSPKEKKSIGVDAIRDITSSLYISPNENDYCVYIIDDAHLMTAQAQNALLNLSRSRRRLRLLSPLHRQQGFARHNQVALTGDQDGSLFKGAHCKISPRAQRRTGFI